MKHTFKHTPMVWKARNGAVLRVVTPPDRFYRWFRATGGVVLDERRRPRRACGSLVDIDAVMKADAEKKKAELHQVADGFQARVGALVQQLSAASTVLETTARSMSATAATANQQTSTIAGAAEAVSSGVHSVAAASEELAASIGEIGRQVAESTKITGKAVSDTQHTDTIVRALANGAERIGHVVGLITSIAGQTNLLHPHPGKLLHSNHLALAHG
jgi:hypothetical protein